MLSYHLVLVTLYHGLKLVLSKTIRIGDTKSYLEYLSNSDGNFSLVVLCRGDSNIKKDSFSIALWEQK